MRIVCISDTHFLHEPLGELPRGDVLVHAGDMCGEGTPREVEEVFGWLSQQTHPHKVVIAGNHDWPFQREPAWVQSILPENVTYLQDSGVVIEGIRFWGSPWQPAFFDWAFNLPRGPALAEVWSRIPDDTRVLITHGPPRGISDYACHRHLGCDDLRARVRQLRSLQLHVFGHIHEGYGHVTTDGVQFVNASILGLFGETLNAPIVVDIDPAAATHVAALL